MVWSDSYFSNTIQAQRYNVSGVAQGSKIVINAAGTPQVAMDDQGDFVILYGNTAIRYDNNGAQQGSPFSVNSTGLSAGTSSIAMDASGNFVVAFTHDTGTTTDIYVQRFNASGGAQGTATLVSSNAANNLIRTVVAIDSSDAFAVGWSVPIEIANAPAGTPVFTNSVYVQRYNSSGVAQGTAIPISSAPSFDFSPPGLAMDDTGSFVVTWVDESQGGSDAVLAQRYDAGGVAQGSLIHVNTTPANNETRNTSLSMDSAGDFVVTWANDSGSPTNLGDVYGQQFNAAGTPLGNEFRVNTTLPNQQGNASVAMNANRGFVVTWTSNTSNFGTGRVFFQRYNGDQAPVMSGVEPYPLTYAPNAAATSITSTLQLADVDDTNLVGATIQISGGYQSGDSLTFADTANISGSFNSGTGILTLTGSDTLANYQTALRSVKYVSTSQDPAARTVSFQVTDGILTSNVPTRGVGGLFQLVGTTLTVYGTQQLDVITVAEAANLTVTVHGVTQQFTPAQVTAINIYGNDGNDSITISSLAAGTALNVYGENGNDSITVASTITNNVTLDGGSGNDLLLAGSGNDTLIGGIGSDLLNGGDGFDQLTGGVGDDVYAFSDNATNEVDKVFELAGEGSDLLDFTALTSAVTADLTSDTVLAAMGHRIVQAGAAGQALNFENVNGGSANDFLAGNASNNVMYGNGGNDTLKGFDGNDQFFGGDGNDLIFGGNQNDVLSGGIGDDYLIGEAGNDCLQGDTGYNALVGGIGDDTYFFTDSATNHIDTVTELADEGIDTLNFAAVTIAANINLTSDTALGGTAHEIVIVSGAGQAANFENVVGGSANDQITGNASNNLLSGGNGNDTIFGGSGNDVLIGDAGNDTLMGITGRNILIGGTGSDLIQGGTDDDVLIGGSTSYDSNSVVLNLLLAEWASANTYQTRTQHLLFAPGGANQGWYLNGSTVDDDSTTDYLVGGGGQNLSLGNGDVLS